MATGSSGLQQRAAPVAAPMASYANYFEIGHNAAEFLIDVGQVEPESGDVRLAKRIALSPTHAKLLARMLDDSVARFERDHGAIPDLAVPANAGDFGLTNPDDFERRAVHARQRALAQHSDPAKR